MGFKIFKWKEIWVTYSLEEKIKVTNILSEHGIPVKTKVKNTRNRISQDVILGGNRLVLNSTGIKKDNLNEYIIYTQKEFADLAEKLLYRNK